MPGPIPGSSSGGLPPRLTPRRYVVCARHGDDTILLNAMTGHYYTLNATGSHIWEWLCEGISPETVAQRLSMTYKLPAEAATADAQELFHACAAASLFEEDWPC